MGSDDVHPIVAALHGGMAEVAGQLEFGAGTLERAEQSLRALATRDPGELGEAVYQLAQLTCWLGEARGAEGAARHLGAWLERMQVALAGVRRGESAAEDAWATERERGEAEFGRFTGQAEPKDATPAAGRLPAFRASSVVPPKHKP